jgi:hypothetical protein
MRRFWGSGSRMETYLLCVELSMQIGFQHMLLVVFPFCGVLPAHPFLTLCSGSGTNASVEEERSRKTGLLRLKILSQIEGWIIPFHCEWNNSRWIDDMFYRVMCVDGDLGCWADEAVVAST